MVQQAHIVAVQDCDHQAKSETLRYLVEVLFCESVPELFELLEKPKASVEHRAIRRDEGPVLIGLAAPRFP